MITAPCDIRPLVGGAIARSLAADRYVTLPETAADQGWRQQACQRIKGGTIDSNAKLPAWNALLDRLAANGASVFNARLVSRLIINASGSVLENGGLSLDRISGVPFVPGSALKGCARREALNAASGETDSTIALPTLADIALVFGWTRDDWVAGSDFCLATSNLEEPLEWNDWRARIQAVLATELGLDVCPPSFAGRICFLPAFPASSDPGIDLDVVTNHHREYYNGKRRVATDDEVPNPVIFPTVRPSSDDSSHGVFRFALHARNGCKPRLLAQASEWLKEAIASGIGARTSSGYGRFLPDGFESAERPKSWLVRLTSPCFCTGADAGHAEIRASSIRGLWRWWFRALGGTPAQEKQVFGGIGNRARESQRSYAQVIVRFEEHALPWNACAALQNAKPEAPLAYIGYPIKKGAAKKGPPGIRLARNANLGPGTSLWIERIDKSALPEDCAKLADLSWECVLSFGGLGYRASRGFGSWSVVGLAHERLVQLTKILASKHDFTTALLQISDWKQALETAERWIKQRRKKRKHYGDGIIAAVPNPLGYAYRRRRQSSATQFRVVTVASPNGLPTGYLLAFEPYYPRVLGEVTLRRKPEKLLKLYGLEAPEVTDTPTSQ